MNNSTPHSCQNHSSDFLHPSILYIPCPSKRQSWGEGISQSIVFLPCILSYSEKLSVGPILDICKWVLLDYLWVNQVLNICQLSLMQFSPTSLEPRCDLILLWGHTDSDLSFQKKGILFPGPARKGRLQMPQACFCLILCLLHQAASSFRPIRH